MEFDDSVTNKTNIAWNRTVLHGCSWRKSLQATQVGNIEISSDDYVVKIPQSAKFMKKWDYEKLGFAEPERRKLNRAELNLAGPDRTEQKAFFTGDIGDIVILGIVEEEIPINGSMTSLKAKYEGMILTVKGFVNNTGENVPLGHYQIIGK